ncbi:MAG: SRPBCC family protein, partial [Halobacteriales archaeon]
MASVSVSRTVEADVEAVEALIDDVEPFMRAGGFTETSVDGDRIHLEQDLGLGRIELDLDVVEATDAALAYEQRDGIFESMRTRY